MMKEESAEGDEFSHFSSTYNDLEFSDPDEHSDKEEGSGKPDGDLHVAKKVSDRRPSTDEVESDRAEVRETSSNIMSSCS